MAALLCLASFASTPVSAASELGKRVKEYLQDSGTLSCATLYGQLKAVAPSGDPDEAVDDAAKVWYWPSLLYLASTCSDHPGWDAASGRPAAEYLIKRGMDEAGLYSSLLGIQCYIQVRSYSRAMDDLDWVRGMRKTIRESEDARKLWKLLDECDAYCSFNLRESRVREVSSRPTLLLIPFDLRSAGGAFEDEDASSAAITWLVLESMRRIAQTHPLPSGHPLTVEEDLTLRFSDGRVCGVNSRYDEPYERGLPFKIASYMKPVQGLEAVSFGGYISVDTEKIQFNYVNLDSAAAGLSQAARPLQSQPDGANQAPQSDRVFAAIPGLAAEVAAGILSRFPPQDPHQPRPDFKHADASWQALPSNGAVFQLFTEAVGFESRGNFAMAARRYQETLDASRALPQPPPDSQTTFVADRLARCQALWDYDTPERFQARNDGEFRRMLRKWAQ